jgi:nucleoside 2-deoxyribosyltransferase
MKLYLAAMFSRREEMSKIADILKDFGFEITARWVYGGEDGLTREQIALLDIEDVDKADAVVSFSQPYGTPTPGGGRHVEFGYGLAKGKRTILIGERECVFHHHPDVAAYPTIGTWLKESLSNAS